jgi:hypothetical protein
MAFDSGLRDPKEIEISCGESGQNRKFVISKMSAFDGRRVSFTYQASAIPKIGDYQENEKLCFLMMTYVSAIDKDGKQVRLVNKGLVDNYVVDSDTLIRLEKEMLDYNTLFLPIGNLLGFLPQSAQEIVEAVKPLLEKIVMECLVSLSQNESAH